MKKRRSGEDKFVQIDLDMRLTIQAPVEVDTKKIEKLFLDSEDLELFLPTKLVNAMHRLGAVEVDISATDIAVTREMTRKQYHAETKAEQSEQN